MKKVAKKTVKKSVKATNRGSHVIKSAGGSLDKGGKVPASFRHFNPDTISQ